MSLDRLSPTDVSFLEMETDAEPMHVGGVFTFDASEAGDFDMATFVARIRARLHLVPRYRQRLAATPFNLANPVWVDDTHFDLAFHVRHAALPRPGTMHELLTFAARVLERPLDRRRPLWELYVVEGLEGDKRAIIAKTHHAMIDGIAGMDIASMLLDTDPDPGPPPDPEPWSPAPTPSGQELLADALKNLATSPAHAAATAGRILTRPQRVLGEAVSVARGVVSAASGIAKPAPKSVLNQEPGMHRRFAVTQVSLDDVKDVKNVFGTTVNDVVLAIVSDATGRLLRLRGEETDGLWLRAMVPVSTREAGTASELGNKIVSVFVDLPMFEMDPAERLRVCHEKMAEIKKTNAAVGARFIIGLADFAPPMLHAQASRLASSGRLFNFLVTNVPGPQVTLYSEGARLLGMYPFTPLSNHQSYAVGITSVDGMLNVGITADWDALPDVDRVTGFLRESLAELRVHGEAQRDRLTGPAGSRTTVAKDEVVVTAAADDGTSPASA